MEKECTDTGMNRRLASLIEKAGIYMTALLLFLLGMILSPHFMSPGNLMNILRGVSLLGIASIGMAFVVYTGYMCDLTVPTYMAFSGIITVASLPLGIVPAVILGILAGMAVGAMNGLVIGRLKANPILWTLAVVYFMEGLMRFVWSSSQLYPDQILELKGMGTEDAKKFVGIFRVSPGGIPLSVLIMIILFILTHLILTRTGMGKKFRLLGSSRNVADFTGIDTARYTLYAFLFTSFFSAIAGIFITSMNKMGVFYLGQGYDFKAVTAVVLGGMMQTGGTGSVRGVLGGVLVIGLISNILTLLGLNYFQQNIITGMIFLTVITIHQRNRKLRETLHV